MLVGRCRRRRNQFVVVTIVCLPGAAAAFLAGPNRPLHGQLYPAGAFAILCDAPIYLQRQQRARKTFPEFGWEGADYVDDCVDILVGHHAAFRARDRGRRHRDAGTALWCPSWCCWSRVAQALWAWELRSMSRRWSPDLLLRILVGGGLPAPLRWFRLLGFLEPSRSGESYNFL